MSVLLVQALFGSLGLLGYRATAPDVIHKVKGLQLSDCFFVEHRIFFDLMLESKNVDADSHSDD